MEEKKNIKRKIFVPRSIYISSENFGIDKEVDKYAKKDENIPKEIRESRSSLVSFITILLWKQYIIQQKNKEAHNETNTDYN